MERLSRDELVALVRRIMAAEGETQEEADRLVDLFEANVPHPAATDLIFWPRRALGDQWDGRELTPEDIVDRALAYRPIQL